VRRRLTLTVLAVTTMVAVAFLVPLGAVVKVVAADRGLAVAEQEAQSLAGVLAAQPGPGALRTVLDGLNSGNRRVALVYLPDGTRVGPALAVPLTELAAARAGRAFTSSGGGYTRIWVAVRLAGGGVSVGAVSVPAQLLTVGVVRAWVVLGLVGAFVVAAGVALADRLGRSMVRPIEELGRVTRRLRSGDLSIRVKPSGPEEVTAVGTAVNELAERINELLTLEREAAADLSHGLRTPLAALRLDAESIRSRADRSRIVQGVGEVTSAVDSLIQQVREGRPVLSRHCADLSSLVRGRLEFWSLLAAEQSRQWQADLPDEMVGVASSDHDVAALVDALVGNVFSHTPEGVAFRVELTLDADAARLVVSDAGPGFAPGFVVGRGSSGAGSTGLGLDIARKAADAAGGSLTTGRSESGGARVEARLGLARVASAGPPGPAQPTSGNEFRSAGI